ncbi:Nicotinate dehydrogenase small FeS subunit [Neomoorella glycerini]|uniref:Nicotinate dehydrogenase small FeS subunit n=1 Tax=Neomoorella glycerini TaxID=55779 RepID=A0A6I5ZNK0_9FIRM|nr:(2Fe-2S)-binding protein [Moorella glycerini]QGP91209.1 Nicotinate dehydrogenase small FeS subunit [Moorella glycerini]
MSEKISLQLKVNGRDYTVRVAPNARLLDVLRDELMLTGTKEGCGIGECGACTVIMDGQAVNSCLVLAAAAEGKEIITIEGLEQDGRLHPLQEAFIKHNALQCGFCTPGMIMSAKALLDKNPHPTRAAIRAAIAGNLCRCTGYEQIVAAIEDAATHMAGRE